MLPPFFCQPSCDSSHRRGHYQQRKLEMLRFWRDGLERQLAAVTAAMSTLEGQIQRDHNEESLSLSVLRNVAKALFSLR